MLTPAAKDRHWFRLGGSSPKASAVGAATRAIAASARTLEDFMIGRVAALVYGFASYLVFVLSSVYAVAFIGNYLVPKSIDVGPESSLAQSILIDGVLLGAFAVQHSVMARPAFK